METLDIPLGLIQAADALDKVYFLSLDCPLTSDDLSSIQTAWQTAWASRGKVPICVVLPDNAQLSVLSEKDLKRIGLMLIPEPKK